MNLERNIKNKKTDEQDSQQLLTILKDGINTLTHRRKSKTVKNAVHNVRVRTRVNSNNLERRTVKNDTLSRDRGDHKKRNCR